MNDEFAGMGGSYVIDDETQTRRLVHRTDQETEQPAAPAVPAEDTVAE